MKVSPVLEGSGAMASVGMRAMVSRTTGMEKAAIFCTLVCICSNVKGRTPTAGFETEQMDPKRMPNWRAYMTQVAWFMLVISPPSVRMARISAGLSKRPGAN